MNIHVAINGVRQDPQPDSQVRGKITTGEIPADALLWQEGWTEWRAASAVYPEFYTGGQTLPPSIPSVAGNAEAIRKAHLTHEASVKSIGSLYLLAAVLFAFAGLGSFIGEQGQTDAGTKSVSIGVAVILVVLAILYFQIGRWLRGLNPKGRTPATVLAVLGLLGFPIGTLINAYVLYLLRSKKGEMVFSTGYGEIIAATPHIKYKTPVIVWILVLLLVGLMVFGVIAAANAH